MAGSHEGSWLGGEDRRRGRVGVGQNNLGDVWETPAGCGSCNQNRPAELGCLFVAIL